MSIFRATGIGTSVSVERDALDVVQQKLANALLDASTLPQAVTLFSYPSELAQDRLALYRGNVTAIWEQALANAYPVLQQLVGGDYFAKMARAYGRAYPSQSGDLNEFGGHLASFLAADTVTLSYPYFADVAALEWRHHRAYFAADAHALDLPQFAQLAQQAEAQLTQAHLTFGSSVALLASDNGSARVWLAHQDATILPEVAACRLDEASYSLVSRLQWQPQVSLLSHAAFVALRALSDGLSLGEALDAALQVDVQFDIAGQLQSWFSLEIFIEAKFLPHS